MNWKQIALVTFGFSFSFLAVQISMRTVPESTGPVALAVPASLERTVIQKEAENRVPPLKIASQWKSEEEPFERAFAEMKSRFAGRAISSLNRYESRMVIGPFLEEWVTHKNARQSLEMLTETERHALVLLMLVELGLKIE